MSDCLAWLLCPYKQDTSDPASRYLSFYDLNLNSSDAEWEETEVEGQEDGLGQSIVCIKSSTIDVQEIKDDAALIGCTILNAEDVPDLMKSPFTTWFNPDTEHIEFRDSTKNDRDKNPIKVPSYTQEEVIKNQ